MTAEDEARLIKEAQKGREAAFEKLVIEHQNRVYSLALKVCGNREDALDVSQDVFLKAYTNLPSFRGDCLFSAWLYRLTYNASIDHLRKKHGTTVSLTGEDGDPAHDIPDGRPLPEEEVERRELRAAVRSAVLLLPDDKREILIMREFSGMNYNDIAAALSLDIGTVKSRISRARAALAEILSKKGTFYGVFPSKGSEGGRSDE